MDMKKSEEEKLENKITRAEALKKAGKYAAYTAAAAITILIPKESQAASTADSASSSRKRGKGY